MAKNPKEVRYVDMSVEELTQQTEKNQEELFKLRFRSATSPLKNPMEIRGLRRQIARLQTFINQRRTKS